MCIIMSRAWPCSQRHRRTGSASTGTDRKGSRLKAAGRRAAIHSGPRAGRECFFGLPFSRAQRGTPLPLAQLSPALVCTLTRASPPTPGSYCPPFESLVGTAWPLYGCTSCSMLHQHKPPTPVPRVPSLVPVPRPVRPAPPTPLPSTKRWDDRQCINCTVVVRLSARVRLQARCQMLSRTEWHSIRSGHLNNQHRKRTRVPNSPEPRERRSYPS